MLIHYDTIAVCGAESPLCFKFILRLTYRGKYMEILKDLTKEHAVIAGIALVAGMALNAMLQYEKMKQE